MQSEVNVTATSEREGVIVLEAVFKISLYRKYLSPLWIE
jgi:hypothetical protein